MPLPSSKRIVRTKLLATLNDRQREWYDQLEQVWAMDVEKANADSKPIDTDDLKAHVQKLSGNLLRGMASGLGEAQIAQMLANATDKGGIVAVKAMLDAIDMTDKMQRAQDTDEEKRGITCLIIEPFDDELKQLADRFCPSCRVICGLTPKPVAEPRKEIAA